MHIFLFRSYLDDLLRRSNFLFYPNGSVEGFSDPSAVRTVSAIRTVFVLIT